MPRVKHDNPSGFVSVGVGQHLVDIGLFDADDPVVRIELLPLGVDYDVVVHDDVGAQGKHRLVPGGQCIAAGMLEPGRSWCQNGLHDTADKRFEEIVHRE